MRICIRICRHSFIHGEMMNKKKQVNGEPSRIASFWFGIMGFLAGTVLGFVAGWIAVIICAGGGLALRNVGRSTTFAYAAAVGSFVGFVIKLITITL